MPDALFAEAKLAEIYDLLDNPDRPDLPPYLDRAADLIICCLTVGQFFQEWEDCDESKKVSQQCQIWL